LKKTYEIVTMFANDFGKAFEFVRQEMRDACIEIIQEEARAGGDHISVCWRIIDRVRKLGPIE